mgnify:CR=1 FL=1
MKNPYKIVFMGTPSFAAKSLDMLCRRDYVPVAVYTQPDKVNGRGKKITFSPVKELAIKNNIPVYQPITFKDEAVIDELKKIKPDIIIVIAYGKILPGEVIEASRYGAINVHASLLPEYRGAAPIQRAVIDRKEKTGITIMRLDSGMDTGDIVTMAEIEIGKHMTAGELFDALSLLGAEELIHVMDDLPEALSNAVPQNHEKATYAEKVTKDMGHIDWSKPAIILDALIRGMYPNPGTYTFFRGKRIKIHKAFYKSFDTSSYTPGDVVSVKDGNIGIAASDGIIYITDLQPENHKQMKAADFINGYQVKENDRFVF